MMMNCFCEMFDRQKRETFFPAVTIFEDSQYWRSQVCLTHRLTHWLTRSLFLSLFSSPTGPAHLIIYLLTNLFTESITHLLTFFNHSFVYLLIQYYKRLWKRFKSSVPILLKNTFQYLFFMCLEFQKNVRPSYF